MVISLPGPTGLLAPWPLDATVCPLDRPELPGRRGWPCDRLRASWHRCETAEADRRTWCCSRSLPTRRAQPDRRLVIHELTWLFLDDLVESDELIADGPRAHAILQTEQDGIGPPSPLASAPPERSVRLVQAARNCPHQSLGTIIRRRVPTTPAVRRTAHLPRAASRSARRFVATSPAHGR